MNAAPLPAEPAAVLAALATGADAGLRLNDLSAATALPTGHVGRHLRTLERERLARFAGGRWEITLRGARLVAATLPAAA